MNIETKVCKKCGRELPVTKYKKIYGKNWATTCNDCVVASRMKTCYENGLKLYQLDESMWITRKYKKINQSQTLRKSASGIDHIARDEKFVRLLDYKDSWVSNYGRIIVKDQDNYVLAKGSYSKADKEMYYTLQRNVYIKGKKEWGYKKERVSAGSLVIKMFIVNYDMKSNTMIWHENNDRKDNYYKHLYPVTELQYGTIKDLYDKNRTVTEDQIMAIVNAVEYKAESWNPWYFRRSYEGIGYLGTGDVDCTSDSYIRWYNMIQRCYNRNVQRMKPYYKGKTVCEEWHNYQNFKIWYDEHFIPGSKVDLDKDLLCKKSNTYGPETCVFITHFLNTVFEDRGMKTKIAKTDDGKFTVSVTVLNKRVDLGTFETEEEAKKGLIDGKIQYINDLAEKCRGKVPDCVYQGMKNWNMAAAS